MAAAGQGLDLGYIEATASSASVTGDWVTIIDDYCYSFQWEMASTGTPVGTVSIQVTNYTDGNWTTQTLPGTSANVNGAANGLIEVVSPAHGYARLVYTSISGGGAAGFKANFRKVRR